MIAFTSAKYLLYAAMSVFHDPFDSSPAMKPVTDFMTADSSLADFLSKAISNVRDKPIIRYENCTKTPEEIGNGTKFMLCSVCKSKLDSLLTIALRELCPPFCLAYAYVPVM
jgi:hypothetical protein